MEVIHFKDAETYEPQNNWIRKSLCNNSIISIEHFVKSPKHSSPKHDHPNSQILFVLKGQIVIETKTDKVTLNENDTVFIPGDESHIVTNPNKDIAIGLDIFVPGRSFDFWKNRIK
jgi:quercetin dioxygenase-like cupin family protein